MNKFLSVILLFWSLSAGARMGVDLGPFGLKGDLRYRHQTVTEGSKDERRVQALMAKLGVNGQPREDLKIGILFMTGERANGGNQTLGAPQGMPRRWFGLEHAYAIYQARPEWNLYLGRMPQFFYFAGRNQMILDRDISLEGLGTRAQWEGESLASQVNIGSFWIAEKYDTTNGKDEADTFLNVIQGNVTYKMNSELSVLANIGLFGYTGVR